MVANGLALALVGETVVEAAQLDVAVLQLLINGRELLVHGLQLFLGGFQLFVGALQLFVAGQDLFVGGLQLFVGGLLGFDDRLEIFLGGGELLLEPGDFPGHNLRFALGPGGTRSRSRARDDRRIRENNHEIQFLETTQVDGHHFKVHEAFGIGAWRAIAIAVLDLDIVLANGDVFLPGFGDSTA